MEEELEIKLYPVNKKTIREKLTEIGAQRKQKETLHKRCIFGHEKNPQIQGTYVRVRNEGDKIRLSLKVSAKQDQKISDQKELDFIVDDFGKAREFLKLIGLTETGYQENLREVWQYNDCEVVIDTWPGLKPYIEIEGPKIKDLKSTTKELGLDWKNKVIESVEYFYKKKYGLDEKTIRKYMFKLTFEDNPF